MNSKSEALRFRQSIQTKTEQVERSPYHAVAEDLDWFRDEWCSLKEPVSNAALRRSSATLRQLLCQDMILRAWRHHELEGRPILVGPDLLALAEHHGHELRHAASVIAGGACVDGVQFAFIGAWRMDNPTTGVSADADEGFAVGVGSIARDVRGNEETNELTPMVDREWRIDQYLKAPGAIRRGQTVPRRLIIDFFANYAGGVHLDRATGQANAEKRALYELVEELEERVAVDKVEGLYFELLAIGQSLGNSQSLRKLAKAIRQNEKSNKA